MACFRGADETLFAVAAEQGRRPVRRRRAASGQEVAEAIRTGLHRHVAVDAGGKARAQPDRRRREGAQIRGDGIFLQPRVDEEIEAAERHQVDETHARHRDRFRRRGHRQHLDQALDADRRYALERRPFAPQRVVEGHAAAEHRRHRIVRQHDAPAGMAEMDGDRRSDLVGAEEHRQRRAGGKGHRRHSVGLSASIYVIELHHEPQSNRRTSGSDRGSWPPEVCRNAEKWRQIRHRGALFRHRSAEEAIVGKPTSSYR